MKASDIHSVIGLFRVSTEEQELEGNSLDAQERIFQRDCDSFGWRPVHTFRGQESGRDLDSRHIIHEVLAAIRDLKPDALWVREQSRLTRGDQLDVAILLRELRESCTRVVTEGGHILDLQDVEGEFVFGLKALIDRRELQVIKRRITLGKDEKARRGLLSNGRAPYGYMVTGDGRESGQRVPHPEESQVVSLIFDLKSRGKSLREISSELHKRRMDPPSVARGVAPSIRRHILDGQAVWSIRTLSQMLHNPTYIGVSFHHCWTSKSDQRSFDPSNPNAIWIEDAHKPIVTKETWNAAHHQLKSQLSSRNKVRHMLTGILCCPKCGTTCFADGKSGRGQSVYYLCGKKRTYDPSSGCRKRNAKACTCRYFDVSTTDELMWNGLIRLISDPQLLVENEQPTQALRRREELTKKIEIRERKIASTEHKLSIARDKLLSEILTDDEYLKEKRRLEQTAQAGRNELLQLRNEFGALSTETTQKLVERLAVIQVGARKLSRPQQIEFLRSIVARITPCDETLRVCKYEFSLSIAPKWAENGIDRRSVYTPFR